MKSIRTMKTEWKNLPESRKQRVLGLISAWGSVAWATAKALMGIFTASFFLVLSGLYSACLGLARHIAVDGMKRYPKKLAQQRDCYAKVILVLFLATAVFFAYMIRLVFLPAAVHYAPFIVTVLAVAAVAEFIFAVKGTIKACKHKELLYSAMAGINLNGAFSALVLAEVVVISLVTHGENSTLIASGGLVFGSLGVICCLVMIAVYVRTGIYLRKLQKMDVESDIFRGKR